jgi:hypothetical protein
MEKDAITVHAMFPIAHHQTQTTAHDIDTALLFRGRAVARAGCEMAGWRTHDAGGATCAGDREYSESPVLCARYSECTPLFLGFLRNAFTYMFPPPLASTKAGVPSGAVKEWNTRPSESEIFSTVSLQPFESTLFNPLPSQPLIGHPAFPVQDRNQHQLDDPPQPPKKRMKVNIDVGPLDELIPLVHDPSSARSRLTHDDPSSLITFPPLTTHALHHLVLHLMSILRPRPFHPKQRPPSMTCSRASMLGLLG